jgi:hypothetical protein
MACASPDLPLPTPITLGRVEHCFDAPLPMGVVPVLSSPTDPSTCLSASTRARGLALQVTVTPTGKAVAVAQPIDLCTEIGPTGEELPRVELASDEEECILAQLGTWRFAAFDTCAHQSASLKLGGTQPADSALSRSAGRERAALHGAPANRCS